MNITMSLPSLADIESAARTVYEEFQATPQRKQRSTTGVRPLQPVGSIGPRSTIAAKSIWETKFGFRLVAVGQDRTTNDC